MKVKVTTLKGVDLPMYQTSGSVGMDLTAHSIEHVETENGVEYLEYGTGVFVEIPEGYELQIRPRSSIRKTGLFLTNSPGTIDQDYRGEIKVSFRHIPDTPLYAIGERIAQAVLCPIEIVEWEHVDTLSETKRGAGGHGSTGE